MKVINLSQRYIPRAFSAIRASSRPPSKGDLLKFRIWMSSFEGGKIYQVVRERIRGMSILPCFGALRQNKNKIYRVGTKTQSVRMWFQRRALEHGEVPSREGGPDLSGWGRFVRAILIILALAVFSFKAAAQQPDSTRQIQKYLQIAAEQNPKLKAEFYQYRAVLEQAPQVGTLPDPKMTFMYFTNPRRYVNPFSRTTISVMQQFPWFGTLEAAENRVQELAKAKLESFLNSRNELFSNIKKVWFNMYELMHHLKILNEHLTLLQSLKSIVLTMYETGKSSQIDVLRLQMEMDRINTRIKQKQEKMERLQVRFNAFLNRGPQSNIHIPMPMEHHTLALAGEELLQKIEAQNPKLDQLDFQKQAARYALEKAQLDGLPSFSIGVSAMLPHYMYMSLMPGNRTAFVAKLSVSIPIYRSRYKAEKQEARLTIQSIKLQRINLINNLTAEAKKWLQKYRDAQFRITLFEEKLIPKTNRALELAIESYSNGKGGFEGLIQLQEQLLKYEMKLNTAYVERNIAVARIEYLYGKYNLKKVESIEY